MKRFKKRSGFTILELMIFAAIFSIVTIAFLTILVAVVRIQARQGSAGEVNQQSDFALSTIQRYVETSASIDMTPNVTESTLTLRMPDEVSGPLTIYLDSEALYLKRDGAGSTAEIITNEEVKITSASFTKRIHPNGGRDSVSVQLIVERAGSNPQNRFTRVIDGLVARVSAATFDSNLLPSSNNTYDLGASSQAWTSINEVLHFSGNNVGVGALSPTQPLEVNGGIRLNPSGSRPSCDSSKRGTLWLNQGGASVSDSLEMCIKNGADAYVWIAVY